MAKRAHRVVVEPIEASADGWPEAMAQYLYWREAGLTDAEMLLAVDITPPRYVAVDAQLVVRALAGAWRQLQRKRAA